MADLRANLPVLSLAQHFEAPSDHVGQRGWICGYSADATFMNDAAERFTALTQGQRAQQGRLVLGLMTDPHNALIPVAAAPGVAHLGFRPRKPKPFRLLHAKVAILGYRCMASDRRDGWHVRLLVSTGNWTRQTVEESLDLVWRIDVTERDLLEPSDEVRERCDDIFAAWSMMKQVMGWFDTRLMDGPFAQQDGGRLEDWVELCGQARARGIPRFIDSRVHSLLHQLPHKVRALDAANGQRFVRNYLAMGSGFYEGGSPDTVEPSVPLDIIKALRGGLQGEERGLLTGRPEVDLYVNPQCCQSIASDMALKSLEDRGITVRAATAPSALFGANHQRSLHAKFLFSASRRSNSSACLAPWVYLGSGNLTGPGFCVPMGPGGNLEAGVVFAPESLSWRDGPDDTPVVTNLLPIQWDDAVTQAGSLQSGPPFERSEEDQFASPCPWLVWHKKDDISWLMVPEGTVEPGLDLSVISPDGHRLAFLDGKVQWPAPQPRSVCLHWLLERAEHQSQVPVMDASHRLAATELPSLGLDEAWWQLAAFPQVPEVDSEPQDSDDASRPGAGGTATSGAPSPESGYPVRRMMELLENIAAKQTQIPKVDWSMWCRSLEQTLKQAKQSDVVRYFRDQPEPRINPLAPLRQPCFRPPFAEDEASAEGRQYEAVLDRVTADWGVLGARDLGAHASTQADATAKSAILSGETK